MSLCERLYSFPPAQILDSFGPDIDGGVQLILCFQVVELLRTGHTAAINVLAVKGSKPGD